mmetsp:Transcript_29183/g.69677  ORF Transcript_29183/g.69677 Transcript_29183/m.69677 type:complete len:322 (-) Transcript_29183:526-1491(-)
MERHRGESPEDFVQPMGFYGIEKMLSGKWDGSRPSRYDEDEWRDVMLTPTETWPCAAPQLGTALITQGYMRAADELCQASRAATSWARMGELATWMVEILDDEFCLLSSLVGSSGHWIKEQGFPVVAAAGGSLPLNFGPLHMEMSRRESSVKALFALVLDLLRSGHQESAFQAMEDAHRMVCSYTTLLWQSCRVELEDWLFQCRMCMSFAEYVFFLEKMHRSMRPDRIGGYLQATGVAFGVLYGAPAREAAQKILSDLPVSHVKLWLTSLFVATVFWVHKHKHIKPLEHIRKGFQPKCSTLLRKFSGRKNVLSAARRMFAG